MMLICFLCFRFLLFVAVLQFLPKLQDAETRKGAERCRGCFQICIRPNVREEPRVEGFAGRISVRSTPYILYLALDSRC